MIRGLLRLILVVVLLVGVAAFFLGYRWADGGDPATVDRPVGMSGRTTGEVDTERARETGAAVGEKVAEGANQAQRAAADASVTAKIKAKMALDDVVKAANIDVDTTGSTVTLSGRVATEAERARAVDLAEQTEGVASVRDQLTVGR